MPNSGILKRSKGITLIEIMITIAILSVAAVGASGYRYYSTLDARKADMRMAAARIGLLLCESWRGVKGDETYDPIAALSSDLTITTGTGPTKPNGFTLLGNYSVVLNGVNCYATLSWKDVYTDLRALNVVVAWAQHDTATPTLAGADKSFKLTIYTDN